MQRLAQLRDPRPEPAARRLVEWLRRSVARSLAPAVALLVTASAGAGVPGSRSLVEAEPGAVPSQASRRSDARDFERLLRGLDGDVDRLQAELGALEQKSELLRARIVARGRAYYRLVRAGLLPVGGGFESFVDHATRVEQLRSALERDLDEQTALGERRAELDKELRRVRAERAPLEVQRQAMARAQAVMQQADERRAAFERAFGGSVDPADPVAVYGAGAGPAVPAEPVTGTMAGMHGRLAFPLNGRAQLAADGSEAMGGPGVELRASRDTAVSAVYPGRVVFVGEYLEHGLSVLVEHGAEYYSLYGRLSRVEVKLGDEIPERGRLGWVARHGSRAPTLYFELRHGTAPLDAARWLGL